MVNTHATLHFLDRQAFRVWLERYGAESGGVWLLFGKKGGPRTLSASEALEEALCSGWIDGQLQSIDGDTYRKYFARRRIGSKWSDKNKALAESLIDRGLMRQPGLDAICDAKKRGYWNKPKRNCTASEQVTEFINLLLPYEPAHSNLMAMPPSVQKTYASFYYDAKQEKTRQTRLEKIVSRLNRNLRPM